MERPISLERVLRRYADIWHRKADGYRNAYETACAETAIHRDGRDRILRSLRNFEQAKKTVPAGLRGRQLCFLHIGKTAGTSVQHALLELYHEAAVFHESLPNFDLVTPEELAINNLVLGHFMFQHVAKMPIHRFLMTFLREPIERVVSNYYFLRSGSPISTYSKIAIEAANDLSLLQFLSCDNPAVRMISENFQAKALAYDIRPEFDSKIDDLQATAERNLSTFDFVGIVERFDDSIAALSTILEAEIKIKRLNVNQRREHAPTISAEELELARKLNAIDIAVYSKARGAFQEKFHGILGNAKNEDRYFFG